MPQGLNKKILCFVDEYGTAGFGDLYLGAVFVMAFEAGRVDKCLSDLLEPSANEIHATNLADSYLQSLMQRFWTAAPPGRLVMINRKLGVQSGHPPVLYAQALIETVKIGLKRFRNDVLDRATIGNVEVITDANHHNGDPAFSEEIARARQRDGVFRAVNQVVQLDSAASRLLQLADAVAHSRKWIVGAEMNAAGLRQRFGIGSCGWLERPTVISAFAKLSTYASLNP
ncbi:MAG: DUF3800 domain-containing protein [Acidocella sp.]|nr:DUF3800 domain-containing protein [Acidocella sp.]